MENKVSLTLSQNSINEIMQAVAIIEKNLPALINLTAEERHMLPKMGDRTLSFVTKSLDYAKQNSSIVPAFLDVAEFEKDVIAVTQLKSLLRPLLQLTEKLDDTTLETGSEAYSSALVFYNAVKGAAKAGVPGMKTIADDLQTRFLARANSSTTASASKN